MSDTSSCVSWQAGVCHLLWVKNDAGGESWLFVSRHAAPSRWCGSCRACTRGCVATRPAGGAASVGRRPVVVSRHAAPSRWGGRCRAWTRDCGVSAVRGWRGRLSEPAASHGAHSRQIGAIAGDPGGMVVSHDEPVDLVLQVHKVLDFSRQEKRPSKRALLTMSLHVWWCSPPSSPLDACCELWQCGPCAGCFGREVPCQGVSRGTDVMSAASLKSAQFIDADSTIVELGD